MNTASAVASSDFGVATGAAGSAGAAGWDAAGRDAAGWDAAARGVAARGVAARGVAARGVADMEPVDRKVTGSAYDERLGRCSLCSRRFACSLTRFRRADPFNAA